MIVAAGDRGEDVLLVVGVHPGEPGAHNYAILL